MKSIHTPAYQRLAEILAGARKNAGMTQKNLAKGLGKPQSFVAKLEGRERRLDIVEFLSICKVLGLDPCEIIRKLEPELPSPT